MTISDGTKEIDYLLAFVIVVGWGLWFMVLLVSAEWGQSFCENNSQLYSLDYMINLELKSLPTDVPLFNRSFRGSCDQSLHSERYRLGQIRPSLSEQYFFKLPAGPSQPAQMHIF